ncbi:MAG: TAXI family TRAP transporter solute-binding subunit [Planctomycetota bacterium]|jgi:TRAP transporter TAXI family solute receptor
MRTVATVVLILGTVGLFAAGCGSDGGGDAGPGKKTTFVNIGTGGETGVYYPAGGAIARLVNKKTSEHGIKVSVEATDGSVYNVNAILKGDLEIGLVQSDRQYQAFKGIANWEKKGPQEKLRAVCSLHPELVTLVAADEAKIEKLADLKGKRVSIGNPGSGQRGNALDVLGTAGIDWQKDLNAEGLKPTEMSSMLQDGRIDAFFYTVGHPSGAINEATAGRRKVHFVPVTGMEKLLAKYPYYATGKLPVHLYPMATNPKGAEVSTIGVVTTVVTRADVPEEVVYTITKTLFENLDEFRKLHKALEILTRESMLKGLSAPLHPGAARYYREAGLKK